MHMNELFVTALRTISYTAIAMGLLFQALPVEATLPQYKPPTLEEKVKRAEVIVVATVGDIQYYKWPEPTHSSVPEISELPLDSFEPYVNLVDLHILYGENAALPAHRNQLKTKMLLWTQQRRCFAAYGEAAPELFPKGQQFVFFISRPSLTSQGTFLETSCRYKSEPVSQLPTVAQFIRSTKQEIR